MADYVLLYGSAYMQNVAELYVMAVSPYCYIYLRGGVDYLTNAAQHGPVWLLSLDLTNNT